MSTFWKDRVAQPLEGAPDSDSYYDLIDTGGDVKLRGVKLRLKNTLIEPGTPVNAANLGGMERRVLAAQGATAGDGEALTLDAPGFGLADLATVRLKLHCDMGAEATLDVGETGPKPIYSGEAPVGSGLNAGEICQLSYNADVERWYLLAGSGLQPKFQFPQYTGNYATYGDSAQGYMVLTTSGIFTPLADMIIDVFMVGGGQAGGTGGMNSRGGGGGGGGYTRILPSRTVVAEQSIEVVIGEGGTTSRMAGQSTYFGAEFAEGGGSQQQSTLEGGHGGSGGGGACNGGTGGAGGSNGSDGKAGGGAGGTGQGRNTFAFEGDYAPFDTMLFSGGGGGGSVSQSMAVGGDGGGGRGGSYSTRGQPATPNTGGGGGGGGAYPAGSSASTQINPGAGGSGIVIIRWGYEDAVKAANAARAAAAPAQATDAAPIEPTSIIENPYALGADEHTCRAADRAFPSEEAESLRRAAPITPWKSVTDSGETAPAAEAPAMVSDTPERVVYTYAPAPIRTKARRVGPGKSGRSRRTQGFESGPRRTRRP